MYTTTPTQENLFTGVRAFLLSVLPSDTEVIQGQQNRSPQPKSGDHVVMWSLFDTRLETNIHNRNDVRFTGSIASNILTVTNVNFGIITVGVFLFGVDVAAGTKIISQGTGTGNVGTYVLDTSQAISSRVLSCGADTITQHLEATIQLDIHGDNASENARIISTLLRDETAVDWFNQNGYTEIEPLFADDPRQTPFTNAEDQLEQRWSVDAHFQMNVTLVAPQQYADAVEVDLINVDAVYPPS